MSNDELGQMSSRVILTRGHVRFTVVFLISEIQMRLRIGMVHYQTSSDKILSYLYTFREKGIF